MERSGAPSRLVFVGRVVRPVGLRGELIVERSGDDPRRFAVGARLLLGRDPSEEEPPREVRIRDSREHGGRVAVHFEGIDSIEAAEPLRGAALYVHETELPPLPPGVYYHYQVIGLTVVDPEGAVLGRVSAILSAGGNDVYCVGEGREEILIPAVRDYVGRIDIEGGRLYLRVPRSALGGDEEPV
jgi:16S rRNA processing protein RimM